MTKETPTETRQDGRSDRSRFRIVFILAGLLIAGIGGIYTGNWWAGQRETADEGRRVDEYMGLDAPTGLQGDLQLAVEPVRLQIRSGQPASVKLTLTNTGKEPKVLNAWLTPAPAGLKSNQFPFKVIVSRDGRIVSYNGNAVLAPPHEKKDFFKLKSGESKSVTLDLSSGAGGGRWDMSSPGEYTVEVWYETYLTGKYIGVDAWTGTTNHVVVQVTVTS